ncbi:MAG: hypothetical protein ACREJX_13005, partial [Polyangiaceae bacterium]
ALDFSLEMEDTTVCHKRVLAKLANGLSLGIVDVALLAEDEIEQLDGETCWTLAENIELRDSPR